MRLLFISNLYPPYELGGFEQWCHEVTLGLQQRGHVVGVLTSRYGIQPQSAQADNALRTLYLQTDMYHYRPVDFFLKRQSQERANASIFRQVIDEFSPDLTVFWGMWNLSRNLPYLAEQWLPNRLAYFIASYWPKDTDLHEEYWRLPATHLPGRLLKRPLATLALAQLRREGYPPSLRFDQTMCCSRYVRDTLVQAGKLPPSAGVLFGGIDPVPFMQTADTMPPDRDCLRLLYFGSLLPHKGVHTAIEALGLLKQRGLVGRVDLTILGKGHPDYETQLRARVAQLEIGAAVHFAGPVPRGEIPAWLRRFDVFLFTSIWPEPMARTVMEAMASGLLVIGSEVGGQVEMLTNGQNALTFQAEDAAALANHIQRALDEPVERLRLAQTGRQMVLERFTLERMVSDMETWFCALLKDNATESHNGVQ